MTDISKEAVEYLANEADECELSEHSPVAATLRAQAARIEQLEASLATARNDALREAADVCQSTDFNDNDEVRVWKYARHKILALTTKEAQ